MTILNIALSVFFVALSIYFNNFWITGAYCAVVAYMAILFEVIKNNHNERKAR